jgi:bifunctional enzyme CysN/CysC
MFESARSRTTGVAQAGRVPRPEPSPVAPAPLPRAMQVVVTGHVDHGKSTVVGRLLADTGSLPTGKLASVRTMCERRGQPFEYAYLLDALKDERAQGITIDAARVFFKTAQRPYILIDAPGHVEFLKNMVTGASRADSALLVIDAKEGILDNSRRHGYLLSMLGIRQIAVLVNKLDLVGNDRAVFDRIVDEYRAFLGQLDVDPAWFIPVSAVSGENVASRSGALGWYEGPTVVEALDGFTAAPPLVEAPLRMPVQGVYKFTEQQDDRRIVAGTIDSGRLRVGDEVVFLPSGKKSRVRSLEAFNRPPLTDASAGQAVGFTLTEQVYIGRGEVVTRAGEPRPDVTTRMRVNLFWLGRSPLTLEKEYTLKLGTARVPARVEQVHRVVDASALATLEGRTHVDRHEVADCTLVMNRPLAFDAGGRIPPTGRFVIVDDYEISGGGTVRDALPDRQAWVREKVLRRNRRWEPSGVSEQRRAERLSQRPFLLVVTGDEQADRKRLARDLEVRLFDAGRFVYFLGIGNVLYGVDADIARTSGHRAEHLRRLGEVTNILLDAGLIVIATAIALTQEELELVGTTVGRDRLMSVWLGAPSMDVACDLVLGPDEPPEAGAEKLGAILRDSGFIFRPW